MKTAAETAQGWVDNSNWPNRLYYRFMGGTEWLHRLSDEDLFTLFLIWIAAS